MFQLLVVTGIIVGLSFLGLGLNLFFRRNKNFPETEIGKNTRMREMGISCVKCSEMANFRKIRHVAGKPSRPTELKVVV